MIDLSFSFTGMQKLKTLLYKLVGSDPLYDALQQSAAPLFADVRAYEASPLSYERTYKLMNSWRYEVKKSLSSASITITSSVDYSPFVRGDKTQAWMHKGRWNTDREIAERHRARIMQNIDNAFSRRINGN
jgi:hypothetical protein